MRFLLALTLLLFPSHVFSAAFVLESGERPVHFLEVYVSEGCSDCPPAGKWMSDLKTDDRLWREIIPVAWHVDYWDHLGWRDALGSRKNSLRQKSTAGQTEAPTYTPGFFLNGREWRGYFDGNALPPVDAPAVGRLRATKVGAAEFIVEFFPTAPDSGALEIGGALLGMDILVPVLSGENRGENLQHDFAVLGSVLRKAENVGGRYMVKMSLSNETEYESREKALVFWVTPAGRFNAVQAVGGWLPVTGR